ncbi:MAG: alginate lyase family protein [Calditrichaeota bacterium]|nr:alginate lyase family protein [Calditrichota bacterium]
MPKELKIFSGFVFFGLVIMAGTKIYVDDAVTDWQNVRSVKDVCFYYHDRMKSLLEALDLDDQVLEPVRGALLRDSLSEACRELLKFYQNGNSGNWLRIETVPNTREQESRAEAIYQDKLSFYGQPSAVPRRSDGRLKWDHKGPAADAEWAWALNRHTHISDLLKAYQRTGNPKYVTKIDQYLRDWLISSLPYPGKKSNTAMWRGLEVSYRVKVWASVFYALQAHEEFRPATRLLLLRSLLDHAHYLRHFHSDGNWITMELSGLTMIGAAWPQFKDATDWIDYAKSTLNSELNRQVYPDGVQTELTSSYHQIALSNFEEFAQICRNAGISLPENFREKLEEMWNYLAYTMRPDGYGLLNNDSDREFNRNRVLDAATIYQRDDWRYIASNGREGTKPKNGPSVLFPWAGHFIMRSGYGENAAWAFFDIGPWGTGHQHNDKLHLSISAYGRDLIVDSGRFAYLGNLAKKFRNDYARHSAGHNVILIDGQGQGSGPERWEEPLDTTYYSIKETFDYARGSFENFENIGGSTEHIRAVFYVRGSFWIVVDRIDTNRPRKVQALWHWHPDCTVKNQNGRTFSIDPVKGNLAIIPVCGTSWKVQLVNGREEPSPQGWYSEKYNNAEPATTAIYSASIDNSKNFAWILVPAKDSIPEFETSITSSDGNHLAMRVVDPQKIQYDIFIPLNHDNKASLTIFED